jgi:hypothetical protein
MVMAGMCWTEVQDYEWLTFWTGQSLTGLTVHRGLGMWVDEPQHYALSADQKMLPLVRKGKGVVRGQPGRADTPLLELSRRLCCMDRAPHT